jgi:hypothetical protein
MERARNRTWCILLAACLSCALSEAPSRAADEPKPKPKDERKEDKPGDGDKERATKTRSTVEKTTGKATITVETSPDSDVAAGKEEQPDSSQYSLYLGRRPAVYFASDARAAVQYARAQDRPILIFTGSPGSGGVEELAAEVFSRPSVGREARQFVALRLSITETRQLLPQAKATHPALYAVDPQTGGLLAEPLIGYFSAEQVLQMLDEALKAFGRARLGSESAVLQNPTSPLPDKQRAIDRLSIYRDEAAYQSVRRIVHDDAASDHLRAAAIEAMGSIGRFRAVKELATFAESSQPELRRAAVTALAVQGLDDLDLAIEQLCSENPRQRAEAAKLVNLLAPASVAGTEQFWKAAGQRERVAAIRRLQQFSAVRRQQLRELLGIETSITSLQYPTGSARPDLIASATVQTSPSTPALQLRVVSERGKTVDVPLLNQPVP